MIESLPRLSIKRKGTLKYYIASQKGPLFLRIPLSSMRPSVHSGQHRYTMATPHVRLHSMAISRNQHPEIEIRQSRRSELFLSCLTRVAFVQNDALKYKRICEESM